MVGTSWWVFDEAQVLLISPNQTHKPSERETGRKGWAGTEELCKNTGEDSESKKKGTKAEILTIKKKKLRKIN